MIFEIQEKDVTTHNNCPCCLSESTEKISECRTSSHIDFLTTSICTECGHVFRSKVPSETWFNSAFELRHSEQQKEGFNPMNPEIEKQRYDRYFAIGDLLKNRFDTVGKSILDIGCGPGTGLDAFSDLGFNVVGVDPDESRAKIAVEKGHTIHMDQFSTFETDRKFDFITLIHSLEHFQNPEVFLKKALDFASSNTLFYVEVPDVLDHVLDWNDSLYLAHISNFNATSLENLAQRCGWELVERVNPYAGTELHQGHLAILFKPTDIKTKPAKRLNREIVESIRLRYFNGIPELKEVGPVRFELKEVNDISLGYKGINELKKEVHDNYANRSLTKTAENVYFVS